MNHFQRVRARFGGKYFAYPISFHVDLTFNKDILEANTFVEGFSIYKKSMSYESRIASCQSLCHTTMTQNIHPHSLKGAEFTTHKVIMYKFRNDGTIIRTRVS